MHWLQEAKLYWAWHTGAGTMTFWLAQHWQATVVWLVELVLAHAHCYVLILTIDDELKKYLLLQLQEIEPLTGLASHLQGVTKLLAEQTGYTWRNCASDMQQLQDLAFTWLGLQ